MTNVFEKMAAEKEITCEKFEEIKKSTRDDKSSVDIDLILMLRRWKCQLGGIGLYRLRVRYGDDTLNYHLKLARMTLN